jgi:hypothetical protein
MLDDYHYGLKPARIIAVFYEHGDAVRRWDRETLAKACAAVDDDGWVYFACKRVQHGSNYGMKANTMSDQILQDSYKLFGEPTFVSPTKCEALQTLYFLRYPGVLAWHSKLKIQLKSTGTLTSAGGHKRIFFGRRDDYDTFKQACSEEPQANTTYVTNLALHRLWNDPENLRICNDQSHPSGVATPPSVLQPGADALRGIQASEEGTKSAEPARLITSNRDRAKFKVQPLHQVHDALCCQSRKEDFAWTIGKLKEWFNNPITIAGQTIVIPFEMGYGPSWGKLKK